MKHPRINIEKYVLAFLNASIATLYVFLPVGWVNDFLGWHERASQPDAFMFYITFLFVLCTYPAFYEAARHGKKWHRTLMAVICGPVVAFVTITAMSYDPGEMIERIRWSKAFDAGFLFSAIALPLTIPLGAITAHMNYNYIDILGAKNDAPAA